MNVVSIILSVTENARRVAGADPHGWSIALTSICFVFAVLAILYLVYGISGEYFIRREQLIASGKARFKPRRSGIQDPDEGTATAIAAALALYFSDTAHEKESGVITIEHRNSGAWKGTQASRTFKTSGR